MCGGSIYWAGLDRVYYALNENDADSIGFSDEFIYKELMKQPSSRSIPHIEYMKEDAQKIFDMWKNKEDRVEY